MRDERADASYRTVFISDLHLGSYRSDAKSVLDFLESHRAETLYLVGDVIDLWSLRRHSAWRGDHIAVIRKLFALARSGTRVIVIPGNHDGPLAHFGEFGLEGIEVRHETVLETARGERFLVVHGHEQDPFFGGSSDLVALLCGIGERIGEVLHRARRRGWLGARAEVRERWSEMRTAQTPSRFEMALVEAAQHAGVDGVICGHSHAPADRMIAGLRYLNCGDWLGNCTAITESWSGDMQLLRWGASVPVPAVEPDNPELWIGDDAAVLVQR